MTEDIIKSDNSDNWEEQKTELSASFGALTEDDRTNGLSELSENHLDSLILFRKIWKSHERFSRPLKQR